MLQDLENSFQTLSFSPDQKDKVCSLLLTLADQQIDGLTLQSLHALKTTIERNSGDVVIIKRFTDLYSRRMARPEQVQPKSAPQVRGAAENVPEPMGHDSRGGATNVASVQTRSAAVDRMPEAPATAVSSRPSGHTESTSPQRGNLRLGVIMIGDAHNEIGSSGLTWVIRDVFTKAVGEAKQVYVKPVRNPGFSTDGLLSNYIDVRDDGRSLNVVRKALSQNAPLFFPKGAASIVCVGARTKELTCPKGENEKVPAWLLDNAVRAGEPHNRRQFLSDDDGFDVVVYAGTYMTHSQDGSASVVKRLLEERATAHE